MSSKKTEVLSVFGILSFDPIPRETLANAISKPENETAIIVSELIKHSLVERNPAGYQTSHRLIHTYISSNINPDPEIISSTAEYYFELINNSSSNREELGRNRGHILSFLKAVQKLEDWKYILKICEAYVKFLDQYQYSI